MRKYYLSIPLIVLLILSTLFSSKFDITNYNFQSKGNFLFIYNLNRIFLLIFLTSVVIGVGNSLLKIFNRKNQFFLNLSLSSELILSFFFGGAILSIITIILGFFGLIYTWIIIALLISILIYSNRNLYLLITKVKNCICFFSASNIINIPLIILLIYLLIKLYALNVVIPETPDNDVWEHYLHYFSSVVQNHHIGPNLVWYQFIISKGAGIFFLSSSISDVFSIQVITYLFISFLTLIIFDIVNKLTIKVGWGLLASILFLIYLTQNEITYIFFKNTGVIISYLTFCNWIAIKYLVDFKKFQLLSIKVLLIIYLYIGFYQTLFSIYLILSNLIIIFLCLIGNRKQQSQVFIYITTATVCGMAISMILNYFYTGLFEMSPISFFSMFTNDLNIDSKIGTVGYLYFKLYESNLTAAGKFSFEWAIDSLRLKSFYPVLTPHITFLSSFVVLISLLLKKNMAQIRLLCLTLLPILATLLISIIFATFIQLDTIKRFNIFMAYPLTIIAICNTWIILTFIISEGLKKYCILPPIIFVSLYLLNSNESYLNQKFHLIQAFFSGRISLAESLITIESSEYKYNFINFILKERLQNNTPYYALPLSEYLRIHGNLKSSPDSRLMSLSYSPGYGYFIPFPGASSLPSYKMSRQYLDASCGSPKELIDLLKKDHFKYFLINLKAPFFSPLPFSKLFSEKNLSTYFDIEYSNNDTFLLSLKDTKRQINFDARFERLENILDIKRSGVANQEFGDGLNKIIHQATIKYLNKFNIEGAKVDYRNKIFYEYVDDIESAFELSYKNRFYTTHNQKIYDSIKLKIRSKLINNKDLFIKNILVDATFNPLKINLSNKSLPPFLDQITGLSNVEPWGRWSDKNLSELIVIKFKNPLPNDFVLEMQLKGFGPNIDKPSTIEISGYTFNFQPSAHLGVVRIPIKIPVNASEIKLRIAEPMSPNQINPHNDDVRKLGIGLATLSIIPQYKLYSAITLNALSIANISSDANIRSLYVNSMIESVVRMELQGQYGSDIAFVLIGRDERKPFDLLRPCNGLK